MLGLKFALWLGCQGFFKIFAIDANDVYGHLSILKGIVQQLNEIFIADCIIRAYFYTIFLYNNQDNQQKMTLYKMGWYNISCKVLTRSHIGLLFLETVLLISFFNIPLTFTVNLQSLTDQICLVCASVQILISSDSDFIFFVLV